MKKSLLLTVLVLLVSLMAVSTAHAASGKKKCPKFIASLETGQYLPSTGYYECFDKASAAQKAAFTPAVPATPPAPPADRCRMCSLSGCCSHHGGVSSCPGGHVVCGDGSRSPSC